MYRTKKKNYEYEWKINKHFFQIEQILSLFHASLLMILDRKNNFMLILYIFWT